MSYDKKQIDKMSYDKKQTKTIKSQSSLPNITYLSSYIRITLSHFIFLYRVKGNMLLLKFYNKIAITVTF